MSTGISGSKTVFNMVMTASSLTFGAGGGTSPSGVQAPWVVVASSLTRRLLAAAIEGGVQRVPGERRAFHAAREFMDAGEGLQPPHLIGERGAALRAGA